MVHLSKGYLVVAQVGV
jgi:hypothetical protein